MLKSYSLIISLLASLCLAAIGDFQDNFGPHINMAKSRGIPQNVALQPDMGYYAFSFGESNTYGYQTFNFKLRYSAFISIVDCFYPGDVFQAFDNGVPIALTTIQTPSTDPVADYSNNVWYCQTSSPYHAKSMVFLNPGHHNITIAVINSVYGGGAGFIRVDRACQRSPYISEDHDFASCSENPPCSECPQVLLSEPYPCCFILPDGLIDPTGSLCNQMVNYPK